jgi:hypothetical protein
MQRIQRAWEQQQSALSTLPATSSAAAMDVSPQRVADGSSMKVEAG